MATVYQAFVKFCIECGKPTFFYRFNEETKCEEYRCAMGHVTEVPETK